MPLLTTSFRAVPNGGGRSWPSVPRRNRPPTALVAYEAKHQGEFGFYRVVFTALVEADDPEIREAITGMYRRFHDLHPASWSIPVGKGEKQSPGLVCRRDRMGHDRPGNRFQYHQGVGTAAARQREDMFVATAKYLVKGDSP